MTPVVLQRLVEATNKHDLEALSACFASEFVNDTPAHPDRSFVGREQVRQNWTAIFRAVPDIELTVIRSAVDGESVWAELEFKGTRLDGVAHWMRGVTIFGIQHDQLAWVRFYVEPVQSDGVGVEAVIRQTVVGNRR
jgi:ketosteroid isomerase-like protein